MDDLKNSRALFISGGWELPRRVKARTARQFILHPQQEMIEAPGGSLTVRFKTTGHMEMACDLRMWGDQVEVLAPDPLRDMFGCSFRGDFPALPSEDQENGECPYFFTLFHFPGLSMMHVAGLASHDRPFSEEKSSRRQDIF